MSDYDPVESFLGDVDNEAPSFVDLSDAEADNYTTVEEPFDEPIKIGDGTCRVCGAPTFRPPGLTPTGRQKRTPKYCDLHSTHIRVSDEGPSPIGMESDLRRVQESLSDDLKLFGTLCGPLLPVTGYYVIDNADAFTIALLKLCKNQQRLLRVLYRAGQVAPVYHVAKTVAGVAYSIQVDTKGADAHSMPGERLGVARAFDAVYPPVTNAPTNGASVRTDFRPPPRYAAAG